MESERNLFGTVIWFNKEGEVHRDDGPAMQYKSGRARYFLNGIEVDKLPENNPPTGTPKE